ncbi:MAG: 2,3-bisphosphoglycerate-independent phosphoglycerate mutase [candidate division WOR-3 bacterium]
MKIKELYQKNNAKIVFLVADGLGGIPHPEFNNLTELEYAKTPNLDKITPKSILGLTIPVDYGITPGSGPAHLSLFGYKPEEEEIGRGALEAYGIGHIMKENELAIRANFCTINESKIVLDRRAGRIDTNEMRRIVGKLSEKISYIGPYKVTFLPGKEHRFVIILEGEKLSDKLTDTDPQKEGHVILSADPLDESAKPTSKIVNMLVDEIIATLKDEHRANGVLLRGYSLKPKIESFEEKFGLKALSLANYPMYKGITRILGMDTPEAGENFGDLLDYFKNNYENYDFVYIHYKYTDKAGEDGDFLKKVSYIEELDKYIPEILSTNPDVFVITGDHSTPSLLKSHSWHPNPTLLLSKYAGFDGIERFTERNCKNGSLGTIYAYHLLPLAMACTLKLKKWGA